MLPRYREAVNAIRGDVRNEILRAMNTRNILKLTLYELCDNRDWSQADLVLELLRIDTEASLRAAERLIGKPISYCPPQIRRLPPPSSLRTGDARRVRRVAGNPRVPGSDAWHRFCQIQVGRTLTQLLSRGVTRRDIREAISRKWMRLESAKA